jgi:hypothetical protein
MVNVTPRPLYPRERDVVPIVGRLGGPQDLSGRVRKISFSPVFDPIAVQPLASRYIGYTLLAHSPKKCTAFELPCIQWNSFDTTCRSSVCVI